jgi:hypothetical protein
MGARILRGVAAASLLALADSAPALADTIEAAPVRTATSLSLAFDDGAEAGEGLRSSQAH